jgi:hypothetical protein
LSNILSQLGWLFQLEHIHSKFEAFPQLFLFYNNPNLLEELDILQVRVVVGTQHWQSSRELLIHHLIQHMTMFEIHHKIQRYNHWLNLVNMYWHYHRMIR